MSNCSRPEGVATTPLSSAMPSSSLPRNPKTRDSLHHTRLQILGKLFGRFNKGGKEPGKVAMYKSRWTAVYHCLLHVVPPAGAITLPVLRWTHYWIGPDPLDATTLQFVAKLHKLLMQASIVEAMLCVIRSDATQDFVPLDALSGAVQTTQLSYLWSLDFVSLFTSEALKGRRWRKMWVIVPIPALLVSTALVGPSSAVLMIPGPGCPKVGRIDSITPRLPIDTMFPNHLGLANGLNMNVHVCYYLGSY
jgi:hypothetical protein